jgi:hypothetical protein
MRQIIVTMFIYSDIRCFLDGTPPAVTAAAHAWKRMESVRPNGFVRALVGGCVR